MIATVADTGLRTGPRTMWAAGDCPRTVGMFLLSLGPGLVEACGITPGQRVLDVTAGAESPSSATSAGGAPVTASDATAEQAMLTCRWKSSAMRRVGSDRTFST